MSVEAILSFLTALGVGGVLGAYFQARFQQKAQIDQHEHELKKKRYLCIIMLMLAKLRPQTGLAKMRGFRSDLNNVADLDEELEAEFLNGYVYASDTVLETLAAFIKKPEHSAFVRAAAAMRKDLWGKKTAANPKLLDVLTFEQESISKSDVLND